MVQDQQSKKMREVYAVATHVELVGHAVILKVDERDRANHNSLGIQGIVAGKAGRGSNVYIAMAAGMLTSNSKFVCFVPEEFQLLENPTLPKSLHQIQDSIHDGSFDIKALEKHQLQMHALSVKQVWM
jgi:hypothetical protein